MALVVCGTVKLTGLINGIGHVTFLAIEKAFVQILSPELTVDRNAGLP